jgi:chromosome segregation ATPase
LNTIKAESIGLDSDSDIGDKYKKSNELIKELKSSIGSYSEDDIFELTNLANLYMKLVTMIDDFYDNLDTIAINMIVTNYTSSYKDNLAKESNNILKDIDSIKLEIVKIQEQMRILAVLENRPSKCKIDSCAFISDAIALKKSIKDNPEDRLSELQGKMLDLTNKYSEIEEKIAIYDSMFPKYMKLVSIRNTISENLQLLVKYNKEFVDTAEQRLSESNPFNDIRDYQSITNIINSLKLYKTELDNNKLLEVEYNSYKEKVRIVNANRIMSEKLEKEKLEVEAEISNLKSEIDNYESLIESLSKSVSIESEYSNVYNRLAEPMSELNKYNSIIENANNKSAKAIESLKEIDLYKSQIDGIMKELNPIVDQINLLQGQLTLLNSYYEEYNEYKRSYDIIETIKKYCSPTGGGIQTLFMQLYMSKTLELSNNVLSMLFGGEYKLLDFIINENEFRIPFVGSGLPVDDISSGSSSQICIMGMVINLVLLHQASTKFNIARLDEIDAGLDSRNRSDFINFIFYTMNILEIEQVFMISHSIEADNSNADIIRLKMHDNYESGIQSGNVIFDYNEFVQS